MVVGVKKPHFTNEISDGYRRPVTRALNRMTDGAGDYLDCLALSTQDEVREAIRAAYEDRVREDIT